MAQPIKEDKNITKKSYKTKKQPKKVIDERIPPKKKHTNKGCLEEKQETSRVWHFEIRGKIC